MMIESFFRGTLLAVLLIVLLIDFGLRFCMRSTQERGVWKTANVWASIAFLCAWLALLWLTMSNIGFFSQRLMLVLTLLAPSLISGTAYMIAYQRAMRRVPLPVPPPRELSLVPEPLPAAAWSAILPPILIALAVWWLRVNGGAIEWDGVLPYPARMMSMTLVTVNLSGFLFGAFAFAYWYGAPRTLTGRRPALLGAVLSQWTICNGSLLLLVLSFPSPWSVRLPLLVATAIPIAIGVPSGVWSTTVLRQQGWPWPRPVFYYDASDAAIQNHRGLNMANPWSWVLSATFLGTLATQGWLIFWSWGVK